MIDDKKSMYASISQEKIDDLMAVYNDYLYMARAHEQSILQTPDIQLANEQIADMYPNGFEVPWHIKPTDKQEEQDFAEFVANDSLGNGKSTYVSLQHVKDEENSYKPQVFTPNSYDGFTLGMRMPSTIEYLKMTFPKNATLGNTEFIIDGRYKAVYTGENNRDKPLEECISDPDLQTEIVIMINTSEYFRRNKYVTDEYFDKKAISVYAEEKIAINENNILEIIGSFSEMVKDICKEKYQGKSGKDDVIRALREGFLNLPDNFLEYDDIRNYIRHQWEGVHEWALFMPDKSKDPEGKRIRRVNSYLKYCDKTIYQRMKAYIGALHQMQQIIAEVKPNRLIRNRSESRNKFKKRLMETAALNLDTPIEVELNYLPMSQEFATLEKNVHKLVPEAEIVDDILGDERKSKKFYARMEDYKKRSEFLQSFHCIECTLMGGCVTHGKISNNEGKKLNTFDALDYLQDIGVINAFERKIWRKHTKLRNSLAHSYFSEDLRNQLIGIEEQYIQDLKAMKIKLQEKAPQARKVREGVYEYTHFDGKVVELDHENHTILSIKQTPVLQTKPQEKSAPADKKYEAKPQNDFYKNNNDDRIKVRTTTDGKIKGVRLPHDVYIDMLKRSISWGEKTRWYTNAEKSNYLYAGRSVLRTDKELRLQEYHIGKFEPSFRGGDNLLIDNRHRLLLDSAKRIKEFKFKDENGNIVKTQFEHKSNHTDRISFEDGTNVLISGNDILVSHNGVILSYENQREFLATYNKPREFSPNFNKYGKGGR